jgi:adenylosuccinate lyase
MIFRLKDRKILKPFLQIKSRSITILAILFPLTKVCFFCFINIMEERNIFQNLSPLDHRYYLSNKKVYDALGQYLSEEALIRYCTRVEIALMKALLPHIAGLHDIESLEAALEKIEYEVDPEEVYAEEEKTKHNIRSLANVLTKKVPPELAPFVHLGATSMDTLDTANSLRIKDCVRMVVLPGLIALEESLCKLALDHKDTLQVGRTHGQHAVPITFGFAMAEFVSRLGKSIERLEVKSNNLRGKLAGAVGAYNATSIITSNPERLEADFLSCLGIKPSEYSTQIIESEYLLEMLLEINTAFGIVANLADDLRHLQRSEIQEVREEFTKDQVGSSTMPQKRNPWNCENVKSMWKAFSPRVMTFFMDQISEHQRDLTNSASARFIADYIAGFVFAVERMKKIIASLFVDREKMNANIMKTGDMVLAEPAYILLALSGTSQGHEIIRTLTLECEKNGKRLVDVLKSNPDVWDAIRKQYSKISKSDPESFFTHPSLYTGIASVKTESLVTKYKQVMTDIKTRIGI